MAAKLGLPRIMKHTPDWQKESWQTFEEAFGHVRPERVNKWPKSMKDR
jgi:FPC/CPF motif-containing protein YcgG